MLSLKYNIDCVYLKNYLFDILYWFNYCIMNMFYILEFYKVVIFSSEEVI